MLSRRELEGYLRIDHSNSPGFTAEEAIAGGRSSIGLRGGTVFESATITCSHCQRVVVLNPDRSRSRGYCPKCDHYVCDWCENERIRTGVCKPFKQVIDEVLTKAAKGI